MFQETGRLNREATGEISFVMMKGLYHFGESLSVLCESGRFFPSNHTRCPYLKLLLVGAWVKAVLFRARMAMRQNFWNFAT
jgi:hypothetical protein